MLALEIELLTGGYRATAFNDRSAAEWPVHPARVFSALVAALPDGEARDREEEDGALDALAALDPPEVWASEAHHRPVFEHYVPVNDLTSLSSIDAYLKKLGEAEREMATADGNKEQKKRARALEKAAQKLRQQSDKSTQSDGKFSKDGVTRAAQLIPGPQQSKQPRTFPVVTPHVALVHLVWGEADLSDRTFIRLQGIAARVARLGHSASLVRFRFSASPPTLGPRTRWRPNQKGVLTLRVPLLNQREALEREHERHKQEKARVLPYRPQRYQSMSQHASAPTAQGVFAADGWIVYEVVPPRGGRRRLLHLSRAEELARAFRGALIQAADGDLPEGISGHRQDGAVSQRPHLAFVPLADVGHPWATASILGLALIPPADLERSAWTELLRALGKLADPVVLRPRHDIEVHVERLVRPASRKALQVATWTEPAHRWATTTAIALDRNPGRLDSRDPDVVAKAVREAETTIRASCARQGLPDPSAVFVHRRSMIDGAPAARRFAPYPRRGKGPRRVCVHAELVFDQKVRGPLLLGAGRYFGIGFGRPIHERNKPHGDA